MDGLDVIDVSRETLWVILKLTSPLLLVALLVGLLVSFFQALTQIQEMTLTFIPKILALFAMLFLLLPFFGNTFQSFSLFLFDRIVTIESSEENLRAST